MHIKKNVIFAMQNMLHKNPINRQEFKDLDIAIALSGESSRASMTIRFGKILHELYAPCKIAVYGSQNGRRIEGNREQGVDFALVNNLLNPEHKTSIALCNINGGVLSVQNDQVTEITLANNLSRTLCPIHGRGGISDLLVIDSKAAHLKNELLLHKLIALFENLLHIFDQAERDGLTGLLNRKAFDKTLSHLMTMQHSNKNSKMHHSMYLALIDIDHFKNINDTYGHLYGDEVLLGFSRLMEDSLRRHDWLFRYGGEEFAIVFEGIDPRSIKAVLSRFRETIEEHEFPIVGKITASMGCTSISSGDAAPTIIDKADKALYFSKTNGRNQVSFFETLVHHGDLTDQYASAEDITLF